MNGLRLTVRKDRPSTDCTSPTRCCWARRGQDLAPVFVPEEFLCPEGSPRDPQVGVPATVFRYDLIWEFVSAITEGRAAVPSFYEGLRAQVIADAVLQSQAQRTWMEIPEEPR